MGWDISYHPLSEEEVQSIYFRGLKEVDFYKTLAEQFSVNEFYTEQMRIRFEEARQLENDLPFNKGHAFYIAIILGFLRKFHYIRGGAFSFLLEDPAFAKYVAQWKLLVPEEYQNLRFDDQLTENYCVGVFLPYEQLKQLKHDYETDVHIREKLGQNFSHDRLAVFWKAVDEAIENRFGLMEVSEVMEPNPLDLNSSNCLSNLFNCYPDGALLYEQAVQEQIKAIQTQEPAAPAEKKKGFWARLFGK